MVVVVVEGKQFKCGGGGGGGGGKTIDRDTVRCYWLADSLF